MKRDLHVRYVTPEGLTEEQIAEAREKLHALARMLGRVSAKVCHEMGIQFDMDDPEVAREVMKMTLEGLFLSRPPARSHKREPSGPMPMEAPK